MEPTYFMTAAALVFIITAVRWSSYGGINTIIKSTLFILSFWGGTEALVAWGFLHSPL